MGDWIEQKVNPLTEWVPGSTMLAPTQFRSWWMKMWPSYFHLPKRTLNKEGFMDTQSQTSGKAEQLEIGKTVVALQKIKWKGGGSSWSDKHRHWLPDKGYCYLSQVEEIYSEKIASGAKYKIPPGAKGTIGSLQSCKGEVN